MIHSLGNRWDGLAQGEKAIYKLGSFCVSLILIVASLAVALTAESHANTATERARAYCAVSKSIAEAPLPKTTAALGITISAGFRTAYHNAGCKLGPLTPADPRVKALLPAGIE